MRRRARQALPCLALLCAASPAASQATTPVAIAFVDPERYTDAGNLVGSSLPLRVVLGEMRRIFTELGKRALRPGESLSIEVLDIDLAGYDRPGLNVPNGLRIVSDVGPPRFRLRYALKAGGRTVLSAEETVTDINFLTRYAGRSSGTTLYYEQEVLRDWFRTRIAERQPPRR